MDWDLEAPLGHVLLSGVALSPHFMKKVKVIFNLALCGD
jgi:hypothetical protein